MLRGAAGDNKELHGSEKVECAIKNKGTEFAYK